jgi:hypothetical protein
LHESIAPLKTLPPAKVRSSRVAWGILITAFVVFCFVCVVTGYGINYFLFQSTIPMQVALDVGRGTGSYQLVSSSEDCCTAPQTGHFVSLNEHLWLDDQSQATIFVRDSYHENQLVAAITMKRGTNLSFGYALRPRFAWSSVGYQIDLSGVVGDLDIYVPVGLERPFWLSAKTKQGAYVYLNDSGQYTISASETQVNVTNHQGHAVLIDPEFANPRDVPIGQVGTISSGNNAQEIVISPGPLNLLQTSAYQTISPAELTTRGSLLADLVSPWQCGDLSDPPGNYELTMPGGRPAIRFVREGAENHGETFCSGQAGPGQTGRDVSQYTSLVLKSTFFIQSHSVNACGFDGSECPLTFQIDYVYKDGLGNEQPEKWFHGFYVNFDPLSNAPLRCSSCLLDHDNIYGQTWYTYDSRNLFDLFPEGRRPEKILRLRVYASGHEYDVSVADVELLAS